MGGRPLLPLANERMNLTSPRAAENWVIRRAGCGRDVSDQRIPARATGVSPWKWMGLEDLEPPQGGDTKWDARCHGFSLRLLQQFL